MHLWIVTKKFLETKKKNIQAILMSILSRKICRLWLRNMHYFLLHDINYLIHICFSLFYNRVKDEAFFIVVKDLCSLINYLPKPVYDQELGRVKDEIFYSKCLKKVQKFNCFIYIYVLYCIAYPSKILINV